MPSLAAALGLPPALAVAAFYLVHADRLTWSAATALAGAVIAGLGLAALLPTAPARGLIRLAAFALALPVLIHLHGHALAVLFHDPRAAITAIVHTAIAAARGGGFRFFVVIAPLVLAPLALGLAFSDLISGLPALAAALTPAAKRRKRRRAKTDLHGDADFMTARDLNRLSRSGTGVILGRYGLRNRLLVYPLAGAILTYAPPRMGKTACKILNHLQPGGRGWSGPIVDIDPRGEVFCVVARRRLALGRDVALIDPFGRIEAHKAHWGDALRVPTISPARFNPLDLIREGEPMVADIDALLDALLEPPIDGAGNARHFYDSMRVILRGLIAWVKFGPSSHDPTLRSVLDILAACHSRRKKPRSNATEPSSLKERRAGDAEEDDDPADAMARDPGLLFGLPALAAAVMRQVSGPESGSNFTTCLNALSWLTYPEIARATETSTIDPMRLLDNDLDIFVVVPEDRIASTGAFLRLWAQIPNILTARAAARAPILVAIDEMAAIGRLDRLIDSFNMAAGKGLHYWTITQTESGFERTYGATARKAVEDLAEVVQILGVPRANREFAASVSAAIGHATFERASVSQAPNARSGKQTSPIKEALMPPEAVMQLPHPEQIVLASPRATRRKHAMRLKKAEYWKIPGAAALADPNPYVLAKTAAARPRPKKSGGAGGPAAGERPPPASDSGGPVTPAAPPQSGGDVPDARAMAPERERRWLAVPFEENEAAKAAGAVWDDQAKCWRTGPQAAAAAQICSAAAKPRLPDDRQRSLALDDPPAASAPRSRDAAARIDP